MRKLLLATTMLYTISSANAADVVTQHNDTSRTGWNPAETILTAANVKAGTFGLQRTVALDDQVDAQPLVANGIAYIVTENNTIYAIDPTTGTILHQRSLGTPVPKSSFGNCGNNAAHVGINGTPVIDKAANKLYVIADTTSGYFLHALSLSTLADAIPAVTITASHKLTNGTTYTFVPLHTRQRAALLEANGNIYAGFTSYCDIFSSTIRGFVLGWNASTLKALAANYLGDALAPSSTNNFFLSTIWMSGNGLAAASNGDLIFATGNSKNGTYDPKNNLEESVIRLSSDLSTIKDYFTPSNVQTMDDLDLNSGGVMLIPGTSFLTAGGKDGRLFLLSQSNFGHMSPLATLSQGACWCAESFYKNPAGLPRVVTSAAHQVIVWAVGANTLTKFETMPSISSSQDPGFFTSTSSNNGAANSIIVWAVSRSTAPVLYAFNVANSTKLFSATAGSWPLTTGNSNIVPTVANGQVLVASNKLLAIFGLTTQPVPLPAAAAAVVTAQTLGAPNELSGWIDGISSNLLTVKKRDGTKAQIDITQAIALDQAAPIDMEEAVTALGTTDANGILQAQSIFRAKDSPALWPADQ